MRFPRLLVALVLALFCASSFPVGVDAAKGSGHSAKSGTSKTKTVHVKEYTKKDGTKVKAHDRSAPHTKEPKATKAKAPKPVKTPAVVVARDENGRIKRSEAARHTFEVETGYPHGRPGYVIDHIKPLACGGADDPSNMQWQTIEAAKAKDRVERIGC